MIAMVPPVLEPDNPALVRRVLEYVLRAQHAELQRPHPRPEFAGANLRRVVENNAAYMCAFSVGHP